MNQRVKKQFKSYLNLSSARSEVFQNQTRLRFKPPKCKLMVMNQKEAIEDEIGGIVLAIVNVHEYLGTLISSDGKRNEEISKRIKDAQSVSNEIVQVMKSEGLSKVRLKYIKMLMYACLF